MIYFYTGSKIALINNADNQDDINAIENNFDRYVETVIEKTEGVEVDYDNPQTTYCTAGNDIDFNIPEFFDWYQSHGE